MKRIPYILLLAFVFVSSIQAQFSSNKNFIRASENGETLIGIDEVFVYSNMGLGTTLTYMHTGPADFKWYRYLTNPASKVLLFSENNVTTSTLDLTIPSLGYAFSGDGCGYVLEYGGETKYFWVLDMSNIAFVYNSFEANNNNVNSCFKTNIFLDILTKDPIEYYNSMGAKQSIIRKFYITYNTLEKGTLKKVEVEKTNLLVGINEFSVDAPYTATVFNLEYDQFLRALNNKQEIKTQAEYIPDAISAELKAVVAERTSLNEVDRSKGSLGGSAPLMVDFTSNPNLPIAQYFQWYITNKSDSTDAILYTDQDLRYTFKSAGLYKIKMLVSNTVCTVEDSTEATVIESFLEVPNVFTPNGDGKNDEFRVAFSSLLKFKGIVFNRWGRIVFEWTDPGKGWDGRIGGKFAEPGAYFYIIEAEGSDIDPITKRPVLYKKQGDINLLRGK